VPVVPDAAAVVAWRLTVLTWLCLPIAVGVAVVAPWQAAARTEMSGSPATVATARNMARRELPLLVVSISGPFRHPKAEVIPETDLADGVTVMFCARV